MTESEQPSEPESVPRGGAQSLTITLEPLHGSLLRSIVNALGPQGAGTWRFVAVTSAGDRVEGPTFIAPRSVGGDQTPQPAWAPEMPGALSDLQDELEQQGWRKGGCGEQPWAWTYHR